MEDVEHQGTSLGSFSVQTEIYSGPLELLIDLIERRKLLINDISLAAVTDDYMRHVAMMEQNPLRETAQFVVLASTLLLIKSKSLLPILDLTTEEEESVEDLQHRLRIYQLFRNVAKTIAALYDERPLYGKEYIPDKNPMFVTDKYTELTALETAMEEILARFPKKIQKPRVQVKKILSLEEMIERLKSRIERQLKFMFKDFTGNSTEKTTVIVGFLAVLEMVKQGNVIVRQTARFHDIEIEREATEVPKYS
jgi:segregation and condensation protein A